MSPAVEGAQEEELLRLGAELWEEVNRLRSISESERWTTGSTPYHAWDRPVRQTGCMIRRIPYPLPTQQNTVT